MLSPAKASEVGHKAVSHRENAERAVETFRRLSQELGEQQARKLFIKLIVTRGFTESQMMPTVISSHTVRRWLQDRLRSPSTVNACPPVAGPPTDSPPA